MSIIIAIFAAVVLFLAWRRLVTYVRNDTFAGPRTQTANRPWTAGPRGIYFPSEAV